MRGALLLTLALLAPTALAAGYTLGADRTIEAALAEGGAAVFAIPVHIDQAGQMYAKLLPVDDNAARAPGWTLAHALVRSDGTRVEMGGATDGSPTTLVPVAIGEDLTFETTITPPPGAADPSTVYVALAFRSGASGATSESGASMDEARALTMVLRGAPAPGPIGDATEEEIPPVGPIAFDAPATGGASGASATTSASGEAATFGSLVTTILVLAVSILALAVGGLTVAVVLVWRELRRARLQAAVRVPIREASAEDAERIVSPIER